MRNVRIPIAAAVITALAASGGGAAIGSGGDGDRDRSRDRDDRRTEVLRATLTEYDEAGDGVVAGSGIEGHAMLVTKEMARHSRGDRRRARGDRRRARSDRRRSRGRRGERRGHGGSKTVLHAHGLEPGKAYGSHVHFGACEDLEGHYQHERGGAVDSANEIWLTLNANGDGRDGDFARSQAVDTSGPLSIVIHEVNEDGTAGDRVACGTFEGNDEEDDD